MSVKETTSTFYLREVSLNQRSVDAVGFGNRFLGRTRGEPTTATLSLEGRFGEMSDIATADMEFARFVREQMRDPHCWEHKECRENREMARSCARRDGELQYEVTIRAFRVARSTLATPPANLLAEYAQARADLLRVQSAQAPGTQRDFYVGAARQLLETQPELQRSYVTEPDGNVRSETDDEFRARIAQLRGGR